MVSAALCLGSNQGDRGEYILAMQAALAEVLQPPLAISGLMETEPVGMSPGTRWFFNQIVIGAHDRGAIELLNQCQAIEKKLGRVGKGDKKPRTVDIDILYYGSEVFGSPDLTLPHPALLTRRYCLEGLVRLAPEWVHPATGKTIRELLAGIDNALRRQKVHFISTGAHDDAGGKQ
jgi:2-amino-4-hydroxy-6-hydroxymethyldihydropteridine diphosphokinase